MGHWWQMTWITFLHKEPLLPKMPAGDAQEGNMVQPTRAMREMQNRDNVLTYVDPWNLEMTL